MTPNLNITVILRYVEFVVCLQLSLTTKILEYHESGYMEDLKDLYFRRSKCNANANDGQLQGEAAPMNFNQHAGLYLLLLVGIFVCILLMLLEHATFKWLVPYWRGKPAVSFWKSYSMMFWSQVNHNYHIYIYIHVAMREVQYIRALVKKILELLRFSLI